LSATTTTTTTTDQLKTQHVAYDHRIMQLTLSKLHLRGAAKLGRGGISACCTTDNNNLVGRWHENISVIPGVSLLPLFYGITKTPIHSFCLSLWLHFFSASQHALASRACCNVPTGTNVFGHLKSVLAGFVIRDGRK